jgi:tRNA A37 threonylcarbamoyladenosine biosynthesis protein TsaE
MSNFIFLKAEYPPMAQYLMQAEEYVWSDPKSSLVKSRMFAEILVYELYKQLNLKIPTVNKGKEEENIYPLINEFAFKNNLNSIIWSKIDFIRRISNRGAHHKKTLKDNDSINVLKECFEVSQWFVNTFGSIQDNHEQTFITPESTSAIQVDYQATIEELKALIAQQQANHQNEIASLTSQKMNIEDFKDKNNSVANQLKLNLHNIISHYSLLDMYENELTADQKNFVEQVSKFLNDNEQQVFILRGYAGTGKTYMTKGLIEYLSLIGRSYSLTAPTGKAAKVLRDKTKAEAHTIHKTIYSYKDLKEYKVVEEDGTETYKFYFELSDNSNSTNTIFIVDEASMISNTYSEGEFFRFGSGHLLDDLIKYVNFNPTSNNKIIFIGDEAQLPPVGMNYSPALSQNYLSQSFELSSMGAKLKEVKRQDAESTILANATYLRSAIEANIFNQLQFQTEPTSFIKIAHESIVENYLNSCNKAINGESIIIAYSNNVVDEYNRLVRKQFFPNEPYLAKGDKVMAIANKSTPNGMMVFNGDFGLVRTIYPQQENELRWVFVRVVIKEDKVKNISRHEKNYRIPLSFRRAEIGFRTEDNKTHFEEFVVFENVLYRELIYSHQGSFNYQDEEMDSLEAKALYVDFKNRHPKLKSDSEEFKQALKSDRYFNSLKIKFGYALTCHKAQGSEWNNVFVDFERPQGKLTKDYFRWAYTAITRASRRIYGISTPDISVLDEIIGGSEEDRFRSELKSKIESSVQNTNITITQILNRPWSILCHFSNDTMNARFTIYFNRRFQISNIQSIDNNILGDEVRGLLQQGLLNIQATANQDGFGFAEPFLEDFFNTIKNKIENSGIEVVEITSMQYKERYTFRLENQSCEIDFGYNGKKQFNQAMQFVKGDNGVFASIKGLLGGH